MYDETDYEFKFFDSSGKEVIDPINYSGTKEGNLSSGDTLSFIKNNHITLADLEPGTRVEITPFKIPAQQVPKEEKYSAVIGKDAQINAVNTTLLGGTDFYAFVKTSIQGEFTGELPEFRYKLKNTQKPDSFTEAIDEQTASRDQTGIILFDPVFLNKTGTYEFELTQITEPVEGLILDDSVWTVQVIVTNQDESWNYQVTYLKDGKPSDIPEFIEKVEPTPITYSPIVSKEVTGESAPGEAFQFTLSGETTEGMTLPAQNKISVRSGEQVSFDPVSFSKAGTYMLTITEVKTGTFGFEYDANTWNVTVPVDLVDDQLQLGQVSYSSGEKQSQRAEFRNIYHSGRVKISKTVSGKSSKEAFDFTLSLTDNNGTPLLGSYPCEGIEKQTISNAETFKLADKDSLLIKGLPVGAIVSVEESNPPKDCTPIFSKNSVSVEEDTTIEISCENKFTPDPITYSPIVQKILNGDDPVQDQSFTFLIEEVSDDGAQMPSNPEVTITGAGVGHFDPITFTKAGLYQFKITEKEQSLSGYTFDQNPVELSVLVKETSTGLSIEANYSKNKKAVESAQFTNTYTLLPASFTPKVKKTVEGDAPEDLKNFSFQIERDSNNPDSDQGYQNNTCTVHVVDKEATALFNPLTFSKAGIYTYYISETKEDEESFSYDQSPVTLTVTVSAGANGLEATGKYQKQQGNELVDIQEADFTNTYTGVDLSILKKVVGTETDQLFNFKIILKDSEDNELRSTFTVENIESITSIRSGETLKIGENQTAVIKGLPVGTLFEVTEIDIPDHFTNENVSQFGSLENENKLITFTNVYTPETVLLSPVVEKTVEGNEPDEHPFFTFTIESDQENDKDGDGLKSPNELELQSGKTGEFTPFEIYKEGKYRYYIREKQEERKGYSYDTRTYVVDVTVADKNGKLEIAELNYYPQEAPEQTGDHAHFINSYSEEAIDFTPTVHKEITGNAPEGETFSFNLSVPNPLEGAILPENTIATIEGAGDTSFDPITFTKEGTYQFTISEENTGILGFEYDPSIWNLTVTVSSSNGSLVISDATYTKQIETEEEETGLVEEIASLFSTRVKAASPKQGDALITESAEFTNTYHSGDLCISKTVKGKSSGEDFTFSILLTDSDGEELKESFVIQETGETIASGGNFTLKDSEQKTIVDLPVGAHYQIEENVPEGFTNSFENEEGEIKENETAYVTCVNTSTDPVVMTTASTGNPKTSDTTRTGFYILLFLVSGLSLLTYIYKARRKKVRNHS